MGLMFSEGGPHTVVTEQRMAAALREVFDALGARRRVLAIPPDFTRANSMSGPLTRIAHDYYGEALTDIMPALGTHDPMPEWQWERMFAGVPRSLMRIHKWRSDVLDIGEVPADFVARASEGLYCKPWPVQLNRMLVEGGHDLILSIGQVLPHEVAGMANHSKNLFVGTGGAAAINPSHFIGAAYGMERMMGIADTPLRRIFNYAFENYCRELPIVFIQTVIGRDESGANVCRGLYIGDGVECFERAAALSAQVNVTQLGRRAQKIVAYLDPEEFHSTWLGNKAIYRSRMAIADGGELIVLAPAVKTFGEDHEIDQLIRKYGYRTTPEVMDFVEHNDDLRGNLAAAAHLIHGSTEGRFTVTYCPGRLDRAEIESVGYHFGDLEAMLAIYDITSLKEGWNNDKLGEEFYYIENPALGLWKE
jgi:nickel-dependent lactate racemase